MRRNTIAIRLVHEIIGDLSGFVFRIEGFGAVFFFKRRQWGEHVRFWFWDLRLETWTEDLTGAQDVGLSGRPFQDAGVLHPQAIPPSCFPLKTQTKATEMFRSSPKICQVRPKGRNRGLSGPYLPW